MARSHLWLVVLAGLWTGAVQATPIQYAALLEGANEVPPVVTPGTGTSLVEYDPIAHTLSVSVDFTGLTGNVTTAHIHCCTPPGSNVGVATPTPSFPGFPAGVTAGIYFQVLDLTLASSFNGTFVTNNGGVAGAEAALANGLANGEAYLNIHTSAYAGGEIRGNLTAVPEPTPLLLLAIAIAAWPLVGRSPGTAARVRI